MVTEACQHASGRAFRLSTRRIKKRPLLHCDVSRLRSYDGRALYAHADTVHRADCHSPSLWHKPDPGPPTAGIPKYLPASDLNQDSTGPQPRPQSRHSSGALHQPGYKQGPYPRIEVREQRVGTRTGAEQQSPGHCVQGTLAFASREGRDWLNCSHSHGLFRHTTGQRVLLARRCLPARRLLTGNHVGLHPHHCPCPCPCLPASLPHCSHGARKGSPKPLHRALVLACSGLGPRLGADLRERGRAHLPRLSGA